MTDKKTLLLGAALGAAGAVSGLVGVDALNGLDAAPLRCTTKQTIPLAAGQTAQLTALFGVGQWREAYIVTDGKTSSALLGRVGDYSAADDVPPDSTCQKGQDRRP